ncbi:hypothetical protein BG004_005126 [Podila humilis]|nr:hypothetical protein BG004_005126 [Podila humilis]
MGFGVCQETTILGLEGINQIEEEFRQFKLPSPHDSKEDVPIRERQSRAFCGQRRVTASSSTTGQVNETKPTCNWGRSMPGIHDKSGPSRKQLAHEWKEDRHSEHKVFSGSQQQKTFVRSRSRCSTEPGTSL